MTAEKMLFTLTADDLTRIIEGVFDAKLAPLKEAITKGEELPELMTRRQVAQYLAVTVQSIDNFTRQGLLKKHYLNGLPRFKREEVRAAAADYERYNRD